MEETQVGVGQGDVVVIAGIHDGSIVGGACRAGNKFHPSILKKKKKKKKKKD
jgi:hypothetical protein